MPSSLKRDGTLLLASRVPTCAVPSSTRRLSDGPRHHYLHVLSGEARGLGPALTRFGLRAAGLPYGLVVRLRNAAY